MIELKLEAWPVRTAKAIGRIAWVLMLIVLSFGVRRHLLLERLRHIFQSSAMLAVVVKVSREKQQVVAIRGIL